jgi:hypothetical protein
MVLRRFYLEGRQETFLLIAEKAKRERFSNLEQPQLSITAPSLNQLVSVAKKSKSQGNLPVYQTHTYKLGVHALPLEQYCLSAVCARHQFVSPVATLQ